MKIFYNPTINFLDVDNIREALKREKTFSVNVKEGNFDYDVLLTFSDQIWSLTNPDYWGSGGFDFHNNPEGIEEIMEFLK